MGNFIFNGSTPKKILYNGAEVKKILFNNVEVWHKAIEAGSKSVTFRKSDRGEKTFSFTVPDGVVKLKLTTSNGYNKILTVTPGKNVNFVFRIKFLLFEEGVNMEVSYSFNGSSFESIGKGWDITITVAWSEAINNS